MEYSWIWVHLWAILRNNHSLDICGFWFYGNFCFLQKQIFLISKKSFFNCQSWFLKGYKLIAEAKVQHTSHGGRENRLWERILCSFGKDKDYGGCMIDLQLYFACDDSILLLIGRREPHLVNYTSQIKSWRITKWYRVCLMLNEYLIVLLDCLSCDLFILWIDWSLTQSSRRRTNSIPMTIFQNAQNLYIRSISMLLIQRTMYISNLMDWINLPAIEIYNSFFLFFSMFKSLRCLRAEIAREGQRPRENPFWRNQERIMYFYTIHNWFHSSLQNLVIQPYFTFLTCLSMN